MGEKGSKGTNTDTLQRKPEEEIINGRPKWFP